MPEEKGVMGGCTIHIMRVPQVNIESDTTFRFSIKNRDGNIWFEHKIDLMDKNNGLKAMSNEIKDRRSKFAFLVFKNLKEKTGSWLEKNKDDSGYDEIESIYNNACKIKDDIQREYHLRDNRIGEYKKRIPTIQVSVKHKSVHIQSKGWFDEWVADSVDGVSRGTTNTERLYDKIKKCFDTFAYMSYCKLEREIRNTLLNVENAFFMDEELIAVKTRFDERITMPILELRRWVERVRNTADPDYIPGMECKHWNLAMDGHYAQIYAAKKLHDSEYVRVVGVENRPHHPGKNPNTGNNYDADIWLECDGEKIPVQVGVREGELARKMSDATVCLGEEIQPNEAVSEYGGTNMDYGKEADFKELCKKLKQVPPGGVVLWASSQELLPGSGPTPLKEWYGEIMDKKCIIVWVSKNKATIHHNNRGFDLTLARKLCMALGVAKPNEQTYSKEILTGDYTPDSVEGILRHLAYKSGYSGRRDASAVVSVNDSASVLRHVVETYMKSVAGSTNDRSERMRYVFEAISILESIAKDNNLKPDQNVWVEICGILRDVASGRHEDYVCEKLHIDEIYKRLHLEALFCLTHVVIRLGDNTPPGVLETLTAAASLGGQDGREHRIVLGCALLVGLRQAIPDWYAENESLLFGEGAPDGMNSVLIRVCSYTDIDPHIYMTHPVLDIQNMEKYHSLILEALNEEIQQIKKSESGIMRNDLMRHFMFHVLHDTHGYGIEISVRDLTSIGPNAMSIAAHECGWLIIRENAEKRLVDRAVQFWETVLVSSPEPAALYGFGSWACTKSVDQDTWERLTLRTCEIAKGIVENPTWVIERASSGCNPTTAGIQIIESILRADRSISSDLAIKCDIIKMRENNVLTDIE